MVASDHSPCTDTVEAGGDFFALPGGISGCQSIRPLLLEHGYSQRGIPLPTIAALTATAAARRFHIPAKGDIVVGYDADLALVDLDVRWNLQATDLFYRHQRSAYVGKPMRGRITHTYVRGTAVFEDGRVISPPIGRLVTPRGRRGEPA
jgi:allantoinase